MSVPVAVLTDRGAIARLRRRAGWGLAPGELDALAALGIDAVIDQLVDPDAHGVTAAPDPWTAIDLTPGPDSTPAERQQTRQAERAQAEAAIGAWLDHFSTTPRPLEDWMAWFWHGHFVSGLDKVRPPYLMVQQLRLFRSMAFGRLPDIARAVTVDSAMLRYLDGDASTAKAPNENFSRELLELFTIGIGKYTEDDVKAGARALSGWIVGRTGESHFAASRHDDTPQHYLGRDGVHDVDTVIEAATTQPSCALFVARKLARTLLDHNVADDVVNDLGSQYAASGLDGRVLIRALLHRVAEADGTAVVLPPVPWFVSAVRATGASVGRVRLPQLRAAGQLPMLPPSVAGWPIGTAWFGASTVVARHEMATHIARATPEGPALAAARSFDLDQLADVLGRPDGFTDATGAALTSVRSDPRAVLALALSSADLSVA